MTRLASLVSNAVSYLSLPFEFPNRFFLLWQLVFSNRPLVSELMRLSPYCKWFKHADIQTVIDVGSFTGGFAFAMRQMLPDAQIYSFEPLPDNYRKLVHNLEKFGRFQAFLTALGNERGELTFWRNDFAASSSALAMSDLHKQSFPETGHAVAIQVPVARLDELLGQVALTGKTLLKLDVQGYELEVLRGGGKMLEQVEYIFSEVSFRPLYEGQPLFDDVYGFLKPLGFAYAGNLDVLPSPVDGTILQADALFIRQKDYH
jgi:FkbM family methyltransferase